MNISITGNLGAGKSSTCNELKKYGFEIISAGFIFRELAKEHNMSVVDFNKYVNSLYNKGDMSVDNQIDERITVLNNQKDNVVFDSRLAWHFASTSFKVFLKLTPEIAAQRVYNGVSRQAEEYESYEDSLKSLVERTKLERKRYMDIYKLDITDISNYDFVIDTQELTPLEVAQSITNKWTSNKSR